MGACHAPALTLPCVAWPLRRDSERVAPGTGAAKKMPEKEKKSVPALALKRMREKTAAADAGGDGDCDSTAAGTTRERKPEKASSFPGTLRTAEANDEDERGAKRSRTARPPTPMVVLTGNDSIQEYR